MKKFLSIFLLSIVITAHAFCDCSTVCESLLESLGTTPTGSEIKYLFNLKTILFENRTHYNYACTCATANTGQLIFFLANNHTAPAHYFTNWQIPSTIRLAVNRQYDGQIRSFLPQ